MLRAWAKSANINYQQDSPFSVVCANESVHQHLLTEMSKFAKANKLNSIETVKAIHLSCELFSIENDLLTPTLKSKRPQLRKYFAQQIHKLYVDNPKL